MKLSFLKGRGETLDLRRRLAKGGFVQPAPDFHEGWHSMTGGLC